MLAAGGSHDPHLPCRARRESYRRSVSRAPGRHVALAPAGQPADGSHNPTWWNKYLYLAQNGPMSGGARNSSAMVGPNVDVSNECGPQSETYITLNPKSPSMLTAG